MGHVEPALSLAADTSSQEAFLANITRIANQEILPLVQAIDQDGLYPEAALRQLAAAGGMSAHLAEPYGQSDFGLAIRSIAVVSRVCGATGFMMWCQSVCGLYLQKSDSSLLNTIMLSQHAQGERLGGTALSNPMKSYAGIEQFLLKATPVKGGFMVSGTLPWVSNLGQDHYCGAIATIEGVDPETELMFLLRCDATGVTLRGCPNFSGMEGTATYALHLKSYFVPNEDVIASPAKGLIRQIRAGFVLLQCGMAAGVVQGAIDSMWAVEDQLGHVNQYLDERPASLQVELDGLLERILNLARTPFDDSDDFFVNVLDVRAHGAELSLRAAQSALLHQGARGYLMSSEVQRRIRESHFVAIVTPAIKHLRSEMARLTRTELPA